MNSEIGKLVMYGTSGVCKIEGTEKRCFDGKNENEYWKLIPIASENSVYYIPMETLSEKVRALATKDEIEQFIIKMPDIHPLEVSDVHRRREVFSGILKGGDYSELISLIKMLYAEQKQRAQSGKKLSMADEKFMRDAEKIMFQEFSVVLDLNIEQVKNHIAGILTPVNA